MHGLVDAPKARFDEAGDRILTMGEDAIVQHPLDSCLFLAFDRALRPEEPEDDPPRLLAIFGIHVDDLLGCCNEQDPLTKKLMDKLRALQWPSTQTAPWLQAAVSLLAGNVSSATTATLQEANKILRYAKENHDVGLEYRPISACKEDVTFIAFSDGALHAKLIYPARVERARPLQRSGLAVMEVGPVSRSTLAAESQAASEASDSVHHNFLEFDMATLAAFGQFGDPEDEERAPPDCRCEGPVRPPDTTRSSTTKWVSSEQQYADGLTKQAAAQLLADRLRSHLVRLRSDVTFQASKKKPPQERKRAAEMFAVKRPGRAMTAMFAMCTMKTSEPHHTTNYHFIGPNLDFPVLLFTLILIFVSGILLLYGMEPMTWIPWSTSLDGPAEEKKPSKRLEAQLRGRLEWKRNSTCATS
eukprot:s527_g5.t1